MAVLAGFFGAFLIIGVLWEAFETVILPRRVTRRIRLTRLFYRRSWFLWRKLAPRLFSGNKLENCLSYFGPISLLALLILWAAVMVTGFALLHWAAGSVVNTKPADAFFLDLYMSCTTFFTLGLGDVTPHTSLGRLLTAIECGLGFGFLALIIGYLPALNQAFAQREVSISLLDARAGSPPTAAEILGRHSHDHGFEALRSLLYEWEHWAAEFLEGHLSYPVLAYFRSQHANQSWLAALTAMLDTCSLVIVGVEGACKRQAQLTFAMARHAVVDLALIFRTPPFAPEHDRLPDTDLDNLLSFLRGAGLQVQKGSDVQGELTELRRMYEPYVNALSGYLMMSLPPWQYSVRRIDNWQTSAWGRPSRGFRRESPREEGEHF